MKFSRRNINSNINNRKQMRRVNNSVVLLLTGGILAVYYYSKTRLSRSILKSATAKVTGEIISGITKGATDYSDVSYYHCENAFEDACTGVELLLLHGAKFTKENWNDSGLLQKLCKENVSVTAIDLSVSSDGNGLIGVFDSLTSEGVISGKPLVIVSPSASGKSVISLASTFNEYLDKLIRAWVPVACPSIMSASSEALKLIPSKNIPVLSLYGTRDSRGKEVNKRLISLSNAQSAEIEGGHPCYFDSPDDFVKVLFQFIEDKVPSQTCE